MAVSKVILDGVTLMDVTSDTVDSSNLITGYQATQNDGEKVMGAYDPSANFAGGRVKFFYFVGTKNATTSLSLSNNSRWVVFISGSNANITGELIVAVNTSGGVTVAPVYQGSSITYTTSTGVLAIANGGTTDAVIIVMRLNPTSGTVTV